MKSSTEKSIRPFVTLVKSEGSVEVKVDPDDKIFIRVSCRMRFCQAFSSIASRNCVFTTVRCVYVKSDSGDLDNEHLD